MTIVRNLVSLGFNTAYVLTQNSERGGLVQMNLHFAVIPAARKHLPL